MKVPLTKSQKEIILLITDDFVEKYPWYEDMLLEHKTLNFFELAGRNVYDFSFESIKKAIVNNYNTTKKFADVIVTADKTEHLTMLPANQIDVWAKLEGEIRAARNKYKVWTPCKLKEIILSRGGTIVDNTAVLPKDKLSVARARGGTIESRYKISPIFFVYTADCILVERLVSFDIERVWQLNPVITAKINFKKLDIEAVIKYYKEEMGL